MNSVLDFLSLDKSIPVPLYYQLKTQLADLIKRGNLAEGDLLPTENDFCKGLGLSRTTVRQCLGDLVNEGVLIRYKGRGTFVAPKKIDAKFLNRLVSFDEEMRALGLTPYRKVLELKKLGAYEVINHALCLDADAPLICLKRLRGADQEPIAIQESYLSYEKFSDLLKSDFNKESLYSVFHEKYGKTVTHVHRSIRARNATAQEASMLDICANDAVCVVTTVAYDGTGEPIEYTITCYRGDKMTFSVDLFR